MIKVNDICIILLRKYLEISLSVFQAWWRIIPHSLLPNVIPGGPASVFTRGNSSVKWQFHLLSLHFQDYKNSISLNPQIALGQYAGVGPVKVFSHICPIFRGLGLAMVIVSLFLSFYYNVVVRFALTRLVFNRDKPRNLEFSLSAGQLANIGGITARISGKTVDLS